MSGHGAVDEVDLMLLDALHANPRISFERLGPALSISPATAARRWQRLSESGQAWVSAVPGPRVAVVAAVVEVRALPGRVPDVASGLSSIPNIISVYATDGEFDLHTLVLAADMPSLATLTLERIPATEGVERVLTHTGLGWHSGIHWRLGAIDREQQHNVAEGERTPAAMRCATALSMPPTMPCSCACSTTAAHAIGISLRICGSRRTSSGAASNR